VTCGQHPDWLNINHPKLNLVNHEDYIPKQFLPCFNSCVLEIYMHKIKDLSEHFVYFNDDFYLTNAVAPERFFTDGLPNDIAAFRYNSGLSLWAKTLKNNIRIINQHFDKREVLDRDYDKWYNPIYGKRAGITRLLKHYNKFVTLRTPHNAQPYLKSTFEEVWSAVEAELTEMSSHRVRSEADYTPELFRTWQICRSNFTPYNTYNDTKMFPLMFKTKQAVNAIREQIYSLICLNDSVYIRDFEQTKQRIHSAFERIFPEKSGFEL
jgi:hypothetical protein